MCQEAGVEHAAASTLFEQLRKRLPLDLPPAPHEALACHSPIDGSLLAQLPISSSEAVVHSVAAAHHAWLHWRSVPAPRRGEVVRVFGEILRAHKPALAQLVTLESGKIIQEGLGEVQEMIDICDFAVGLSRQLHGLTIASERPHHRMMETWHPLGVVGVISAFNFPAAVWAWNTALALVCGNAVVWKPSEKTSLTALACHGLLQQALQRCGIDLPHLHQLVFGRADAGAALVAQPLLRLISATGSTAMGRRVAQAAAPRFLRTLLELGGNNAMIVTPSADLDLAVRAILFSAAGTAGQRCTSLRRLIMHASIADALWSRLQQAYAQITIGHPLDDTTLVGPLIDGDALVKMQQRLQQAHREGGHVSGGEVVDAVHGGVYVRPALVRMPGQTTAVREETFAPILYGMTYTQMDEAIAQHNEVAHGLSSSMFTSDIREAELFLSAQGSDCGIANINIGPSGAEIGGAFGGEKDTGGGRESGSDAWKNYMRRATNTINYGHDLPLAQGIRFDLQ
ncbi:MAG: aldehyde dehydrogenase family protein [Burkholderiaceae bacterium]|nr:MAG: aldehyde dehydrogenase family protein [Burkholderiaceae bacterium]